MLFNTLEFLVFFSLVIFGLILIKNNKFQHFFLLLASYFFFYFTSNYLILLLIYSTLIDFYVGKEIWKTDSVSRKKILLIISLAGNLGLLGFFKYADFAILQFNILGNYFDISESIPYLNLALPIGISFYTFQTISYTVDIYRGLLEPSKTLREFALYVAFFPQLVAGPIVRAKVFLPQLREKMSRYNSTSNSKLILFQSTKAKFGITLMAIGFFKKMFFADNIAPLVNGVFSDPIGLDSFSIIMGTIGFGIQIYSDFSGYSDIAIGAALVLGFKLPLNFNKPYFATSPSDFWRRWHISLSSWLRDYLYIPLGGNRKSESRTFFNLFTVMFLGGLWHGASWNFVVWGMLHGSYLAIHRLILDKFPSLQNNRFFKTKFGVIFSIFITQYLVFLTWIPFRVKDFDEMVYSMQKYVFLDFQYLDVVNFLSNHKFTVLLIILFGVLHFISFRQGNLIEKISKLKFRYWLIFLTTIILLILMFYNGNPEDFIYFQF
jgi:D-alanyl-lipoteichoic acid acyltransferase DltB (MBOAT superfamily)